MYKIRIDRYLIKGGLYVDDTFCWTLDKSLASLSTCHLELVALDGNPVKSD